MTGDGEFRDQGSLGAFTPGPDRYRDKEFGRAGQGRLLVWVVPFVLFVVCLGGLALAVWLGRSAS